jgi:hypothetical protein
MRIVTALLVGVVVGAAVIAVFSLKLTGTW